VHSFDGSLEEAQNFINMGLFIGINGCSLKTKANLEVIKNLPRDKMMIETDAPWCDIRKTHAGYEHIRTTFPTKKKEKFVKGECVQNRNEPCNLSQILEVIAGVHGEDVTGLAEILYHTTASVFFANNIKI